MPRLALFTLALKSLRVNKLRSFLSVLGIVIGTFTIVFVNAIGNGVDAFIKDQLSFMSATSIFVEPSNTGLASSRLREEDLEEVVEWARYIGASTTMSLGRSNVSSEWETEAYAIIGTTETFASVMNFSVKYGRYLRKEEVKWSEKVTVVGKDVAKKFFNREDVVGESISIAKKKFRIVGVLSDMPSLSGFSFDEAVYIPFTTAKRFITGQSNNTIALVFLARDLDSVSLASEEIKTKLRKIHNIREGEADDFNVYEQKAMVGTMNLITQALTFLLIGIAVLILIVSGIGIMNIMYASVAERTRDIGIMRAIGARQGDIVFQFLSESIVLALFGALVGILLAELFIFTINHLTPIFQFVRGNFGDIFALAFTVSIALIFGIYPALRASRLDPVDALK